MTERAVTTADIVRCANGRDKDRLFMVVETGDSCVLLADGKHRKLEAPKRKNRKHVRFLAACELPAAVQLKNGDKITDKALRKTMAAFAAGSSEANGGM